MEAVRALAPHQRAVVARHLACAGDRGGRAGQSRRVTGGGREAPRWPGPQGRRFGSVVADSATGPPRAKTCSDPSGEGGSGPVHSPAQTPAARPPDPRCQGARSEGAHLSGYRPPLLIENKDWARGREVSSPGWQGPSTVHRRGLGTLEFMASLSQAGSEPGATVHVFLGSSLKGSCLQGHSTPEMRPPHTGLVQRTHPTLPETEKPCQPAVPAVTAPRPLSRVPRDLEEELKLAALPSLGEPCPDATALGVRTHAVPAGSSRCHTNARDHVGRPGPRAQGTPRPSGSSVYNACPQCSGQTLPLDRDHRASTGHLWSRS